MTLQSADMRVPVERPAIADAGRAATGGGTRARPAAGDRFSALLDTPARSAVGARSDTGPLDAGASRQRADRESPAPTPPLPACGNGSPAPDTMMPAIGSAAAAAWRDGPRAKDAPAAAKPSMAEDDMAGLLDEVADLVSVQRVSRARNWSVTVWLREAVLRDTQLAMAGEPGRVDIRFSTTDPDSLRRLHAGHEELQTRLRDRIAAPHLQLSIESAHSAHPAYSSALVAAGDRQGPRDLGDPD
jgi:Type III secretion protein (HpaP)